MLTDADRVLRLVPWSLPPRRGPWNVDEPKDTRESDENAIQESILSEGPQDELFY